ncbi:MAG: hypothetical protein ACKVRO_13655 [Micropepsaceae bacterium]
MTIWGWLLLGAGSWVLAVVLKVLADVVVQRLATVAFKDWVAALLSGVWSSVCEIGLSAFAFWYWSATFADALVMATGAGAAEFLILLPAALSTKLDKKKTAKATERSNWTAFLTERTVAFASHIAARALAWLGIGGAGGAAALASAFGLFATTEAIQAYGQAKEWDWLNNRTLWTFLFFQIALVLVEVALIVIWWR